MAEANVNGLSKREIKQKYALPSDVERPTYWIHKYKQSQQYGGPEEGGWWFDAGIPISQAEGWVAVGPFYDQEMAYTACRMLNYNERIRRALEEEYEYTSTCSDRSQFFGFDVTQEQIAYPFPTHRPFYE